MHVQIGVVCPKIILIILNTDLAYGPQQDGAATEDTHVEGNEGDITSLEAADDEYTIPDLYSNEIEEQEQEELDLPPRKYDSNWLHVIIDKMVQCSAWGNNF